MSVLPVPELSLVTHAASSGPPSSGSPKTSASLASATSPNSKARLFIELYTVMEHFVSKIRGHPEFLSDKKIMKLLKKTIVDAIENLVQQVARKKFGMSVSESYGGYGTSKPSAEKIAYALALSLHILSRLEFETQGHSIASEHEKTALDSPNSASNSDLDGLLLNLKFIAEDMRVQEFSPISPLAKRESAVSEDENLARISRCIRKQTRKMAFDPALSAEMNAVLELIDLIVKTQSSSDVMEVLSGGPSYDSGLDDLLRLLDRVGSSDYVESQNPAEAKDRIAAAAALADIIETLSPVGGGQSLPPTKEVKKLSLERLVDRVISVPGSPRVRITSDNRIRSDSVQRRQDDFGTVVSAIDRMSKGSYDEQRSILKSEESAASVDSVADVIDRACLRSARLEAQSYDVSESKQHDLDGSRLVGNIARLNAGKLDDQSALSAEQVRENNFEPINVAIDTMQARRLNDQRACLSANSEMRIATGRLITQLERCQESRLSDQDAVPSSKFLAARSLGAVVSSVDNLNRGKMEDQVFTPRRQSFS